MIYRMTNVMWFLVAAVYEIAVCYASWACLRLGRGSLWLVPGTLSRV